jgi:hypothetical protein
MKVYADSLFNNADIMDFIADVSKASRDIDEYELGVFKEYVVGAHSDLRKATWILHSAITKMYRLSNEIENDDFYSLLDDFKVTLSLDTERIERLGYVLDQIYKKVVRK